MSRCYHSYEAAKRQWVATHPDATPAQYDAAMQAIAKKLGI